MKKQAFRLFIRWVLNSIGIWAASSFLTGVALEPGLAPIVISGFLIAVINAVVKPFAIIASLPAILLSVGLFMLFVNGLMVFLASWLYTGFSIDGYLFAILAGLVIGLLNYVVTIVLEGIGNE